MTPAPGGGTSGSLTFTITTPNPVPALTTLSPSSATAGGTAFTLTVNGGSFVSSSVVRWNGTNQTTTFVSATQLIAAISAANIATAGSASVTVFTPAPGGGTSGALPFAITAPPPASLSLSFTGLIRDRVGQGDIALTPDGRLDAVFTATLGAGSGARTVTALELTRSPAQWDTTPGNGFWTLGVASTLDGALLNSATGTVTFAVADGGSFVLFAADWNNVWFPPGATFTLTAHFAGGTSATASLTLP